MITYTKRDIYNVSRKLYYLLRHCGDKIDFIKLGNGVAGYYYKETDEIEIDYRRDIVSTLIHEALHKWHPNWSETKVYRHESRIVNSLTGRQVRTLIKIIGESI